MTIFTKIIDNEIPSYKIAETDDFLAFLDINPNAVGHTLCIPKQEINKIYDLNDDLYIGLMTFSKKNCCCTRKIRDLQTHRNGSNWIRSSSCPCAPYSIKRNGRNAFYQ